jgi:thiamine-monophosphate kinase
VSSNLNLTLGDLGERRIIDEILRPRYGSVVERFGDDCVALPAVLPGHRVVITTDPCPEPMAAILGFNDLYYRGWLLSTINLSDLAAAGAAPMGLLTSLILPSDLPIALFVRLLQGIDDCCAQVGTGVLGGNLKEGPRLDLQATAVGEVPDPPLSRLGCKPGDLVAVVGDLGLFWAGVLALRERIDLRSEERDVLLQNILTPRAKVRAGMALRRAEMVSCAMDNSDGLGPSLETIASTNSVGIELNFKDVRFPDPVLHVSEALNVDPVRLAMGWGDWHLVVCLPKKQLAIAQDEVSYSNEELTVVGTVESGGGIRLEWGGGFGRLTAPDSERFTRGSWFTAGIESYVEQLVNGTLTA